MRPPRPRKQRWLLIFGVVAIVAGLVVVVAIVAGDSSNTAESTAATTTVSRPTTTTTTRATTTASTAPTTTAAPPTTVTLPGFDSGTVLVGSEVAPGRYIATDVSACYWERLSGISGDFNEIIENGNVDGQAIVEIVASDKAFNSNRCGGWTVFLPSPVPATSFGEGDWAVGQQIAPGTYRAGANDGCYWERASGFTHDFGELLANDNPEGEPIVEIRASDARFTSARCGTWTKVG